TILLGEDSISKARLHFSASVLAVDIGDIGLCEYRVTIDDATKARRRLSTSMVVSAAKPMDVVLTLVLAAEAWG
ncbi:MAG TPA: hypothetical protein VL135_13785, partial [Terracidiphilus sp.]|nr:hypothetical protein [Terracidiphilus sp.]